MGFRQGAYAKVWSAEDKGKYSVGSVSVSKKNQNTGEYKVEFQDGFVRFVGDAHSAIKDLEIPSNGLYIQITSCDVTTYYDATTQKVYTNFTIFGFEMPNNSSGDNAGGKKGEVSKSNPKAAPVEEPEDDDLPF